MIFLVVVKLFLIKQFKKGKILWISKNQIHLNPFRASISGGGRGKTSRSNRFRHVSGLKPLHLNTFGGINKYPCHPEERTCCIGEKELCSGSLGNSSIEEILKSEIPDGRSPVSEDIRSGNEVKRRTCPSAKEFQDSGAQLQLRRFMLQNDRNKNVKRKGDNIMKNFKMTTIFSKKDEKSL